MQAVTFFSLFVAVLVLFGGGVLLVRRFAGNRLGANSNGGRMPRLAVTYAAVVDNRRKLVLVRRDNVEHLVMIGGPSDIVVETNIVRSIPARDQMAQRPTVGVGEPPRIAPLPDAANWADGDDTPEPQMPEPPPRPARPSFVDEVRRATPPAAERRNERPDPLAGFAPEPLGGRPEPRPELRPEPMPSRVTSRNEPMMPRPPRPGDAAKSPPPAAPSPRAPERAAAPPLTAGSPAMSAADQNLAEMAQRLEAALRRPTGDAPPVAPEPPSGRPPTRKEPAIAPPVAAAGPKGGFENLEDEMASLLGRPKTPS